MACSLRRISMNIRSGFGACWRLLRTVRKITSQQARSGFQHRGLASRHRSNSRNRFSQCGYLHFLDRVRDIGNDMDGCMVCLECYHGTKLQNTICARCWKEVHVPVAFVCVPAHVRVPTVYRPATTSTTLRTTRTLEKLQRSASCRLMLEHRAV